MAVCYTLARLQQALNAVEQEGFSLRFRPPALVPVQAPGECR